MTQALYFKPSYDRLQERIRHAAPDLDVVLIDEEGNFSHNGKPVSRKVIDPEYFWIHSEMFGKPIFREYFKLVAGFPNARWLHTINTGLDVGPYLDLLKRGITISNNHSQAVAIAEYVMAHVLDWFQDLADYKEKQEQGIWKYRPFREIRNTRWVIIGFGHIGQHIARRAKAFDVHVTAVRRSDDDAGLADEVRTLDTMGEALEEADVVILACASNAGTRNMVNREFVVRMNDAAVLVNVARGDLVVEENLQWGLDHEELAYAILDVFSQEPPAPESWVWQHPKVSLTPHCSNGGSGMRRRSDDLFIENLNRRVNGQLLINEVSEKDIL